MKRLLTSVALFLCSLMTFAQFSGSGSGTENDPYLIFNPVQLNQLRNFLGQSNVYFKLMNNIDLTEFLENENPTQGWQPIGSFSSPFKGVVDGNGKIVSGLWINRSSQDYVGFFGDINGSSIKNLNLEGQSVIGNEKVGGFCGSATSSTISGSSFNGTVEGVSYLGGLFGQCSRTTLSDLSGEVIVNGSGDRIGGIVGYVDNGITASNCRISNGAINGNNYLGGACGFVNGATNTMENCIIYSDIQGVDYVGGLCGNCNDVYKADFQSCGYFGNINGHSNIGGLIGQISFGSSNATIDSNITKCFSISNIIASEDNVGGIIGNDVGRYYRYYFSSKLNNTYHSGTISGGNYVGGLIGKKKYGQISQCYASGDVSGKRYIGGLVGKQENSTLKQSVAICNRISATDGDAHRIIGSNGGTVGTIGSTDENKSFNRTVVVCDNIAQDIVDNDIEGASVSANTLKLKATYVTMGFDFDNAWEIQETECYPYMKCQTAPPVIDTNNSKLVSGQTSITGKAVDGGTIYIDVDGDKQETVSSGYKWSFTVNPLQAGKTVSVYAKANSKEQSYYISELVYFLGKGTETDPYQIYTAEDLSAAVYKGYYILMNDIDLTSWINTNSPTEGWIPIGLNGSESIHFNGNGHKISGLWIKATKENAGLFSSLYGSSIKNLEVVVADNKQVIGTNNTGILIGRMVEGEIENCTVRGSLRAYSDIGGVVGKLDGGSISYCTAIVSINSASSNAYVGGIAGELVGKISFSKANVSINTAGENTYAGGIVGGTSGLSSEIYTSFSSGAINATGASSYTAGIAGILGNSENPYSYVTNCYSTAHIKSSYSAAGVVAYNYGKVVKCYASGNIYSNNYGAGIIGYNDGANASVAECVAINNIINVTFESQSSQSGGYGQRIIGGYKNGAQDPEMNNYALKTMQVSVNNVPQIVYDNLMNGIAKTADELKLQSTYESLNWNFSGVWAMNANTFLPYLQWSNPDRTEQTLSLTQLPTMTYGDLAYQLPTNTEEGLPLTWTSSNTSIATVNGNMLTIRKTGSIVVSCAQEGNGDYFPFSKSFPLTINKASLRITADSHAIHQGEEIPELTVQYEGFKYNEDATCLTTQPSVTTTATSTSAIGNYPIIVSGAEAVNYDISYVNGTLSVVDETTLNNTLYSGTVEIRSGGNASISLELNNEDPIIMVEFFMQLPEGISISVDEDGYLDATLNSNRSNRHSIEVEKNSDGLYHFLVYSSRNNSFKENEGELINIKVECEESMEGGTYQAVLRNILLNDADKNEIVLPDYNFSMHVTDVLLGDVNGDWKINGSDIVEMVDHIMGRPSDTFILAAAELTGDGLVNGSDLVEEISLVMSQGISQAPASVGNHAPMLLASGLALNTKQDGEAVLGVGSDNNFILSQMTLHLSEGVYLNDITTDSRHSVEYSQVSADTYVVLCYSSSNSAFCSNNELLSIHYTGEGVITVSDVMMVGTDRRETYFAPVSLSETTGIEWANHLLDQPVDVYSINGYMVKHQAISLKGLTKGVYLINGNKVIIK